MRLGRRTAAWCTAALLAGGGAALGSMLGQTGTRTVDDGWREIAWPFPQDAWPAGRAFRCGSATCGGRFEVYLRAKRGFCANCAAGVTEDVEVDGKADLDMITDDFVAAGPGETATAGMLGGRARAYTLRLPGGISRPGVGLALSRRPACDLFTAASQGTDAATPAARDAVRRLLASGPVADWVKQQLGG